MTTRILKTRQFSSWVRKTDLHDKALSEAVIEMKQGLIDTDLGGGLFKKRIGISGRGKRAGVRTIIATNLGNRWFFLLGFEKNVRANITTEEREALEHLSTEMLSLTGIGIDKLVDKGILEEVEHA